MDDVAPEGEKPLIEKVTTAVRTLLLSMEQKPDPYLAMNEETLRLVLVNMLDASGLAGATAESYNGRGKVDILIKTADRNLLLAECKMFNGKNSIVKAIDQLLGYSTFRDRDLSLIIFARNPRMTTTVKAAQEAAEHSDLIDSYDVMDEHGTELLLHGHPPDDPDRKFTIRLFVVHLKAPPGTPKQTKLPRGTLDVEDTMKVLRELKRAQPENIGVDYTPTITPGDNAFDPKDGWAVLYTRTDDDGETVGIRATPTTPEGMEEHAPEGAIIVNDAKTARQIQETIRRAERDFVRGAVRGIGFRFDRIAAGLRGPADSMQQADPAHTTLKYGPNGLWQCQITITSAGGEILTLPIAFAVVDEPESDWDATVQGSVYDTSMTLRLSKDEREAEISWEMGSCEGTASEHLAAFRFMMALNTPGTLRIDSIEPAYGHGEYALSGVEMTDVTYWWRDFWTHAAAIEEHTGEQLQVPDEYDADWVHVLFVVGTALTTGQISVFMPEMQATYKVTEEQPALEVGDELTFEAYEPIMQKLGDLEFDLGLAFCIVPMRIVRVTDAEPGQVTYHCEPITPGAFLAALVSPDDVERGGDLAEQRDETSGSEAA